MNTETSPYQQPNQSGHLHMQHFAGTAGRAGHEVVGPSAWANPDAAHPGSAMSPAEVTSVDALPPVPPIATDETPAEITTLDLPAVPADADEKPGPVERSGKYQPPQVIGGEVVDPGRRKPGSKEVKTQTQEAALGATAVAQTAETDFGFWDAPGYGDSKVSKIIDRLRRGRRATGPPSAA